MRRILVGIFMMMATQGANAAPAHEGFVDLADYIPGIVVDARYASDQNFMGRPIDGYQAPKAFMTREAAEKLKVIQRRLTECGLTLRVYDAYRPQRAVDHFMRWTKDPSDTKNKGAYYPDIPKGELVERGYIAAKSGHTRGAAIDLTIAAYTEDGRLLDLDMGSRWDFFGPISHPLTKEVTVQQRANRLLLRTLMVDHGFTPYENEWWHFFLDDEPYPDTYFDFPVE